MKPQNPIIKRDADLGWEIFVPPSLLPVELRTISLSPEGIYIEAIDDSYDLIPFRDLVDLLEGSRTLDENIEFDAPSRNLKILAAIGHNVNTELGQPEQVVTGQQRIIRRWEAPWLT